jgi:beta-galactosidase
MTALSRRSLLLGAVGVVAASVGTSLAMLDQEHSSARRGSRLIQEPGSYDFSQRWLFGGRYVKGAEQPGYADTGFEIVTLPHTVSSLSWDNWDYAGWEHVWIYRKHFAGAAAAGARVLVTFHGVMANAEVVLNGATVGTHVGGYLPWTTELTGHIKKGDNVLAVIVDARWLDVPPDAEPVGPPSMDYLQPGGIYRDVTLDVVPEVYLEDVFARPENVLNDDREVKVEATVNAAIVPEENTATVTATLLDGSRVLAAASTTGKITGTGTSGVSLTIG